MTVTFVDESSKVLGKASFPCCPPAGCHVALKGFSGVVKSIAFQDGDNGIEAFCRVASDEPKAAESRPVSRSAESSKPAARSTKTKD